MLPLHQDKRVKAIAVTGTSRLAQSPDIPTFAEGGLPEFDLAIWNGLVAPAGTPQPVVDKLSAALSQAIDTPEFKTRLEQLAAQAPNTQERGPVAFSDLLKRDSERVSSLVKSANLLGAN
jgi:tripartite-type tricarboxylate transporter receptor subunit TctC